MPHRLRKCLASSAVAVLAATLAPAASATLARTLHCEQLSWSALAGGRCIDRIAALIDERDKSHMPESGPIQLVVEIPVPEPQTYALMLVGLLAVGAALRRRR
jgi:PEP-CTERM motif